MTQTYRPISGDRGMQGTAPEKDWGDPVGKTTLIRWDEPKVVVGIYRGATEVPNKFEPGKKQKRHMMEVEGETQEFFAPASLDRLLSDPRVQPGVKIRIHYPGTHTVSSNGRPVKNFAVHLKEKERE